MEGGEKRKGANKGRSEGRQRQQPKAQHNKSVEIKHVCFTFDETPVLIFSQFKKCTERQQNINNIPQGLWSQSIRKSFS